MAVWCGQTKEKVMNMIPVAGDIGEKKRHVEIPAEEPVRVPATVPAEPQPAEPVPA
jgi:hypothetical protein